jgi:hypothetical protein
VIVFGAATVVFALSQWMWLSVVALAVLGAADTISVVIRFSLVQLATPDEMRGRVGAVNFLFIKIRNPVFQFGGDLILKEAFTLQMIFCFILCNKIQPCNRVFRKSFQAPGLRCCKEGFAGDVLSNFHLVKSKTFAEDRNDFPVFHPE